MNLTIFFVVVPIRLSANHLFVTLLARETMDFESLPMVLVSLCCHNDRFLRCRDSLWVLRFCFMNVILGKDVTKE